jgi:hypothetical protein
VYPHHGSSQHGIGADEWGQRARSTLEQSDERLRITLLAIQTCKALSRHRIGRIPLNGMHQSPRGLMRVPEAGNPNVGGLSIPVARQGGLWRLFTDTLQQRGVHARIALPRTVSLSDGHLVVGVLNQATNQSLDIVLSFHSGRKLARRLDDLQRDPPANK